MVVIMVTIRVRIRVSLRLGGESVRARVVYG